MMIMFIFLALLMFIFGIMFFVSFSIWVMKLVGILLLAYGVYLLGKKVFK